MSEALTQEDIEGVMHDIATRAREAYAQLAQASTRQKDDALRHAANQIRQKQSDIIEANAKDLAFAKEKHLTDAMIDRLTLTPDRIESMAKGLEDIASLPDPVGNILSEWDGPGNGLHIQRVSVPLGVIGIIYESRPNVTADAAALCLKSGNAAILRSGSESLHSSMAIVGAMYEGFARADIPLDAVQIVPTRAREAVGEMLRMRGLIDIIVPRGGKSLTERIAQESRIPTIQHLDGNCHIYVHEKAAEDKTIDVIINAKMRRTGICGAVESLVIDETIVDTMLPKIVGHLLGKGCAVVGDPRAQAADDRINKASDEDWSKEYLDAMISVKTVRGIEEAITHINAYGSHHTDAIMTEDKHAATQFTSRIDSAIVMVNTSTQFADGGEFGMGAEIGISTGRLHARGPVGCEQLTTYKYVVTSDGATRR